MNNLVYSRVLALDDETQVLALYDRVLDIAETNLPLIPGLVGALGEEATPLHPRIGRVLCRTVGEAISATKAAQAEGLPFAIALIDLRLSDELTGIDACEQIRALDPNVNLVIVTGNFDLPPEQISARVPPADKLLFLRKPFDIHSLAHFIVSLSAKWHADCASREQHAVLQENVLQFSGTASKIGLELDLQNMRFREAQEELRLVYSALQSTANAIVIIERNGKIKWSNPAFVSLSGYTVEEIRGRDVASLCAERQPQAKYERIWESVQTQGLWKGETSARRKDGSIYPEEQTITAVYGEDGALSHYVALKEDLSERKQAEEKEKRQQERMVQADKLATLGILVSGVAHEVNNPNHFILSNVTLLRDCWRDVGGILDRYHEAEGDFVVGGLNYSEAREMLPSMFNDVLDGARRIGNIVQELRDYARETPPELNEQVDLNGVMRAATTLMSNMIAKSTDTFDIVYCYEAAKVRGNFQKLEQVVINLLQNACQALPTRDCSIHAEVFSDPATNTVGILVRDHGVGIPDSNLQLLTMPFFTTKRSIGGTGLGLSISSNIIREHGGAMTFEGVQPQGTSVRIQFPAVNGGYRLAEEREQP